MQIVTGALKSVISRLGNVCFFCSPALKNSFSFMSLFHSLTVKEVRPELADCVSVSFKVPAELADSFQYQAGQYLTFRTHIDGQEVRRSYSICSAPEEGELRVAIKKIEGGLFPPGPMKN